MENDVSVIMCERAIASYSMDVIKIIYKKSSFK